uniref:Uncharacterized protein n=1 Tax=Oryza sativa subsp. japonica TaxID=39947 RepID=Q6ERQ6_ORYSJ|nr:hypothetical protein [Oryza sativa Japonica Group]BAD33490.1 hypothetical protein [Oryza sativa Japonica Group]
MATISLAIRSAMAERDRGRGRRRPERSKGAKSTSVAWRGGRAGPMTTGLWTVNTRAVTVEVQRIEEAL